jgi:DNA-binding transcriptional regulator YiaG
MRDASCVSGSNKGNEKRMYAGIALFDKQLTTLTEKGEFEEIRAIREREDIRQSVLAII